MKVYFDFSIFRLLSLLLIAESSLSLTGEDEDSQKAYIIFWFTSNVLSHIVFKLKIVTC